MRKVKVAIVSDSAYLDSGFGRVAREVGTHLQASGQFQVQQLGWFNAPNDRLVPFQVHSTDMTSQMAMQHDRYGEMSYGPFIERFKPDIVIAIGDEWMLKHIAMRPRKHFLIGYVPIDAAPLNPPWLNTLKSFDQLVVFGNFAEKVIKAAPGGSNINTVKIPHGVDSTMFSPLSDEEKAEARKGICKANEFLVGCVARNNARKQLPRLVKGFRQFINAWVKCEDCGSVVHNPFKQCPECGSEKLVKGDGKPDPTLYLHCVAEDPAGHDLLPILQMYRLSGRVVMPQGMKIGRGVTDEQLNRHYNAFDMFVLPTGGEGWGLPILEAMSAGCPVLVTNYSGHVDFVAGAGDLINVAEWDTCTANNGERALVDIDDMTMRMDRFYYEPDKFRAKWGTLLTRNGVDPKSLEGPVSGKAFRTGLGKLARERAVKYDWKLVGKMWVDLLTQISKPMVDAWRAKAAALDDVAEIATEMI